MRSSSSDTFHARLVLHPSPRLLLGGAVSVDSGDYVSMLIRDGSRRPARAKKPLLRIEASVLMVSTPEFLKEGSAVCDSLFPDRIVAKADSREAQETSMHGAKSLALRPHLVVEYKPP